MPNRRVTMAATETATRATQALDDLYRAHVGEVYRYAYAALGNHPDAEDVMQTTFVNALRALERGDRPRKPSNWLITIAHNVVRQRFRTQKARPAEVELQHDIAVEEQAHDGPTLDELVKGLQRIPPTQREALVMRELEGRSYREIQQILELTPAALEMLLFRARRSLAEELENVVTCERAELAMERRVDGRLSRKERRRLLEHLRECPACARLDASRKKRRRRLGALAVLPLPFSLTFFRGAPTASAATGAPTTGAGGLAAAKAGSAGTTGGLLAAGVAVKAVALAAAVTVVAAVGYLGVEQMGDRGTAKPPTAPSTVPDEPAARRPAATRVERKTATPAHRKAARDAAAKPKATALQQADSQQAHSAPKAAATTAAPPVTGMPAMQQQHPPSDGKRAEANATAGEAVARPVQPKQPGTVEEERPVKAQAVPAATPAPAAAPTRPEETAAVPAPEPEQTVTAPVPEPEQTAPAPAPEPEQDVTAPAPQTDVAATPEPGQPAPAEDGDGRGHGRHDDARAWGRDDDSHGTDSHGTPPTRTRHGQAGGR